MSLIDRPGARRAPTLDVGVSSVLVLVLAATWIAGSSLLSAWQPRLVAAGADDSLVLAGAACFGVAAVASLAVAETGVRAAAWLLRATVAPTAGSSHGRHGDRPVRPGRH